jgi:hypothetical protein
MSLVKIKFDIFIKDDFFVLFNPSWKKLYFLSPIEENPTQCGFRKDKNNYYFPVVNPTFMFFPQKYFYTLNNMNAGHEAWSHYMEKFNLTEEDMTFMVEYQFDSNTSKIKNPYYKMVGRDESTIPMNKSKKITI